MSKIRDRKEINNKYKWDLTKIYKTIDDFNKDYEKVNILLEEYKNFENHTTDSSKTLLESIEKSNEIDRLLEKLYCYSHMKSDEDISNNKNQELKNKIINLIEKSSSIRYFEEIELLKLDGEVLNKYYKEEEKLLDYKILIDNIFRFKKYTLSDNEEKLLSNINKAFGNDEETYSLLTDSDMTFGTIKDENGKFVELTDTNFILFIRSKNRRVREDAFKTLYKNYKQYKNTISQTLQGHIKENVSLSKIRGYKSFFDKTLFKDNLNDKVYNTLVSVCHENINVLYDYYDIKKKVLKLDELHLYDTYVDLVEDYDKKYEFEEAKKLVIETTKVFGTDYVKTIEKAYNENWIDIYPNKNKRGGAYSGGCYDTVPYVLLNYQNTLNDVSTVIHELGHSMHSYLTRNNQPYQYGDYPIFVAEVASTVNEILFAKYMIKNSKSKKEKLYLLNHLMDMIKATFFRQTMFEEFEYFAYDTIEKDQVLSSDILCDKYLELNKLYFGKNVNVDEEIKYEWERIPHMYYNFYVYKYATGISAAINIVEKILNNEENAVENYLNMLKDGSCNYPLDTLKIAGVDMTKKETYLSVIKLFKETLEEFDSLINE